jgi:hypothetical protein
MIKNRRPPLGLINGIPYMAAVCLSKGEARAGMSFRSQDFFDSFFYRMKKRNKVVFDI